MKKILLAMCVLALSSGMAFADCDGGEMITIGEKSFCGTGTYGTTGNWWSMQAWCQAHGMALASAYDICPNWNGGKQDLTSGCVDFRPSGRYWTSTVSESNKAYQFGGDRAYSEKSDDYAHPLCK